MRAKTSSWERVLSLVAVGRSQQNGMFSNHVAGMRLNLNNHLLVSRLRCLLAHASPPRPVCQTSKQQTTWCSMFRSRLNVKAACSLMQRYSSYGVYIPGILIKTAKKIPGAVIADLRSTTRVPPYETTCACSVDLLVNCLA